MFILLLILHATQVLPEISTRLGTFATYDSCYQTMVEVEAHWRQAYPGFEAYRFECQPQGVRQ